jgi:hypothetical protein
MGSGRLCFRRTVLEGHADVATRAHIVLAVVVEVVVRAGQVREQNVVVARLRTQGSTHK